MPTKAKSTKRKTTGRDALLERVGSFLQLGADIYALSMKCDGSLWNQQATADMEIDAVWQRIHEETKTLQRKIPTDKYMEPLRKYLRCGAKQPPAEPLQLLSYVAYSSFALAANRHNTPDSIAAGIACVFSDTEIEGILTARKAMAGLLLHKVLSVDADGTISLTAELRFWLAGRDGLAQYRLSQDEVHVHRRSAASQKRQPPKLKGIAKIVEAIPLLKPSEINEEIGKHGYIGQNSARKTISLAAYRHILRLRRIHIEAVPADQLPSRENVLLMGPTGAGKSFLIKTLFGKILNLPTAIVDATTITETGYVGEEPHIILTKLHLAAEKNVELAQLGIACIDEFDKLASSSANGALYGGQGTTKDVSGLGVQRSLLKMLEEDSVVDIPADIGVPMYRARRIHFKTGNVMFMACGAFTGIETVVKGNTGIGFNAQAARSPDSSEISALSRYGLANELLGRFGSIVRFDQLSSNDLMAILGRTICRYSHDLKLSGIELVIEPDVRQTVVRLAIERGTGARSLTALMDGILRDGTYCAYSSERPPKALRIYADGTSLHYDLKYARRTKKKPSTRSKVAT